MKALCVAVAAIGLIGCQSAGNKPVKLESRQDKVSYSIGLNVGNSLKKDSIAITPEALLRGVMDAGADSAHRLMSEKEVGETMMAFQEEMRAKQEEMAKEVREKGRIAGEAYLAANAKKPGVVTLQSGLQYRVITEGKGKMPKATSTVTANYVGKLIDGTEFDSSFKRGSPSTFPVNRMIKGWIEALPLMKEGSKWELVIPPSLAWGESGAGGVIPPNATVVFEVELLAVK
jgi:FKBP-type peptidyl-prolyl cis-trans isomerase FklB